MAVPGYYGEPRGIGAQRGVFCLAVRCDADAGAPSKAPACPRVSYRSATATGTGAPFGEDKYPVTVFLADTLLTTISNIAGSLPL